MSDILLALGAASSPIQPVPALDIEELLDNRPWNTRPLAGNEVDLLRSAEEFLEKARKGLEIVKQTATTGTITLDVVSLDAYEYTRNALENAFPCPSSTLEETREVINRAFRAVQAILLDNERDAVPERDAELALQLFGALAHYSYSRTTTASVV